jgi:hypothetical protein
VARWKALPAGLDPAVVDLVVQLRQLKDSTPTTFHRLAEATGYSVSSWRRYLEGAALPPREAVERLARFAAADSDRLLVRYDAARDAWEDRARQAAPDKAALSEDRAVPERDDSAPAAESLERLQAKGRSIRLRTMVLYCAASAIVGTGLGLLVRTSLTGASTRATTPTVLAQTPVRYACTYTRRTSQWYAGNSSTDTAQLEVDMSGPDVAELQCLLQRAGFSPGGVDGNFGPLTESAVIRAQKADRLDVDGQVGPSTWGALRG